MELRVGDGRVVIIHLIATLLDTGENGQMLYLPRQFTSRIIRGLNQRVLIYNITIDQLEIITPPLLKLSPHNNKYLKKCVACGLNIILHH